MTTYKATNQLSGTLRIRLSNGEFIILGGGESVLLNEDNVKVVKGHEGIQVEELISNERSRENSYIKQKRKRGK